LLLYSRQMMMTVNVLTINSKPSHSSSSRHVATNVLGKIPVHDLVHSLIATQRRLNKRHNNSVNSSVNLSVNVYWESRRLLQPSSLLLGLLERSQFFIDNVNPACSTDDIRSFVTGKLSVQVYSCFEVKPRRRGKFDNPDFKRKAFRLCICADDCDKLLNASMWPDSVVISEWFFKPERNTAATADADHRNAGTIITEDADQRDEVVDATTGDVSNAEDDDATILSAHSVATMDTSTIVHDG